MMNSKSTLLSFYSGEATDSEGRAIEDIWAWDSEQLEDVHDYIQWLFPLPEPSAFNPDAPILSDNDIEYIRRDRDLQDRVRQSLDVMLSFYGLERRNGDVFRASNFDAASSNWLEPGNHNHLRLSRILRFLTLIGLNIEARALLACLEDIAATPIGSEAISERTLGFWKKAVQEAT